MVSRNIYISSLLYVILASAVSILFIKCPLLCPPLVIAISKRRITSTALRYY